ncbi:MAG: DNA polymerase I [Nitrospira sp.]|jgi:DNA polymerase-1|nr:DNA polymerase I [Nitrospira sp.]MBK7484691.1 DNA polymerase I [Nitrospira sp.]MBK9996063.1 DNA polymerase I [Nitrospira sp.]MBP6198279.1 DNA polymerase I [Nitrospira sp.]
MPTLYLIDGSAYIYRAFFALPPLANSKGLQTNAVYGFTTMLLKVLRDHRPDYVAVVFDEKGPTHRHEAFKDYKAQRPPMPQGMSAQIPYIHRVVEALSLPVIRQAGYEADDLIGTLARKGEVEGLDVVIVTSDKDMFQLLTPKTRIYDPVKDKWFGEADSQARFGVEPARVVEIMGLMGDTSDNIPGVKGIGEKTAVKLITQFGTIEELLSRIEEVTPVKTKNLLLEQGEQARMSRQLATIQLDCPLEFVPAHFQAKAPQAEILVSLLRELEFMTLAKAFQGETPEQNRLGADVEQIHDAAAADAFLKGQPAAAMLGLACVLTGEPGVRADIQGCALGRSDGNAAFVQGEARDWPRPLIECLHDGNKPKAVQDLKPLLLALHRQGIDMPGPYFDTMVADYLLNPNRRAHTLEAIAMDLLSYQLGAGEQEDSGKGPQSLFDVDENLVRRTGEAAAVTAKVAPMLRERLREQGSLPLFQDVEMPLVPVLAEIERNGFLLDVEGLQTLSKELERELEQMVGSIYRLAGGEFNIGSPKQLATVLFETLGLKPLRKTKTGYSTDEDTLTQLASQHELPAQILNYRTLTKLKSTYVDALPQLVNPETKRLHTSLNQTVAATGRLSSTDPNLQNIPVKGDYGLRIREAFIAPPGHQLLCADYSQVEPRILAHLSQDPRLLQVFEQGEDIHMATAMEIFNLPAGEVTREMRRAAKSVVFGIVYGISPFGLASNIGVPQADAKKYIETFFEKFSAVRALMDRNIDDGKTKGYTTTVLGRRRQIPELQSGDPSQRGVGERMAVNSPIQGSAADLIKVAMIKVHQRLQNELPRCKMILQVHDELIFEVPDQELEWAKQLVKAEMEATGAALGLSVPLKVDLGVGCNWRVAHP